MKKLLARLIMVHLRYLLKKYNKYNVKIEKIYSEFKFSSCIKEYKNDYKQRTDGHSLYFYLLDKLFIIIQRINYLYPFHNRLLNKSIHTKYTNNIKRTVEIINSIEKEYNLPLLTLSSIWSSYRELYDETVYYYRDNSKYTTELSDIMNNIEKHIDIREKQIYDLTQYFNSVLKIVI